MPLSFALLHSLHTECVTEQGKATNMRAAGCPPHGRFCGKVMRGRRRNDSYKLIAMRRYYSAFHNVTAMVRPLCAAFLPATWAVAVCCRMGSTACFVCAFAQGTARPSNLRWRVRLNIRSQQRHTCIHTVGR